MALAASAAVGGCDAAEAVPAAALAVWARGPPAGAAGAPWSCGAAPARLSQQSAPCT